MVDAKHSKEVLLDGRPPKQPPRTFNLQFCEQLPVTSSKPVIVVQAPDRSRSERRAVSELLTAFLLEQGEQQTRGEINCAKASLIEKAYPERSNAESKEAPLVCRNEMEAGPVTEKKESFSLSLRLFYALIRPPRRDQHLEACLTKPFQSERTGDGIALCRFEKIEQF